MARARPGRLPRAAVLAARRRHLHDHHRRSAWRSGCRSCALLAIANGAARILAPPLVTGARDSSARWNISGRTAGTRREGCDPPVTCRRRGCTRNAHRVVDGPPLCGGIVHAAVDSALCSDPRIHLRWSMPCCVRKPDGTIILSLRTVPLDFVLFSTTVFARRCGSCLLCGRATAFLDASLPLSMYPADACCPSTGVILGGDASRPANLFLFSSIWIRSISTLVFSGCGYVTSSRIGRWN